MNEFDYADSYLFDYKVRGNEIIAKICPMCGGGSHRDKYTFYLNVDKHTYVCHRGSCGARGTFHQLAKEKGGKADYMSSILENTFKQKKTYTKPKLELHDITGQAINYIHDRGITDRTIKHFGIKADCKGNIVFPYLNEKGEHELSKFRPARKIIKGKDNAKMWQEGGGRPILFGMNLIRDTDTLIITEGEFDAMSVYECGHDNVVSIPFGTNNFEWVDECWDWLEQFKEIIIYFDSDEAGRAATQEAVRKLGIAKAKFTRQDNCKDANELMFKHGKDAVTRTINNAEYIPVKHFVRLADVEEYEKDGFLYGLTFVDNTIGGCVYGDLNIWTGKRGGAKSSILSQTVIDTVDQGKKVFWYSGELSNARVRAWLETQMCGDANLEVFKNSITGADERRVPTHIANILREWYKENLYIFGDEGGNNEDDLFEMFEYGYRRYDIRRFIIDNLKTVKFKGNGDRYQNQSDFVARCKEFCNKYKVHIDLVVHPRKTLNAEMTDEDIGGSVDIIDLADNVLECKRVPYNEVKEKGVQDLFEIDVNRKDLFLNRIKILKNREYGRAGKETYYKFDVNSRKIVTAFNSIRRYKFMDLIENYKECEQIDIDERFPF